MKEQLLKIKQWCKKAFRNIFKALKLSWKYFKKHYVKIGFYFLAFIFILNAILMSVFLMNRNYDYRILDKLYVEAILPEQDLNGTLYTAIVRIEDINYDELSIGDKIAFCCDMGIEENWVQEVVSINRNDKTLQTTYDGVTSANVSEDEVYGVFVNEANFVGTFYYTSMFPRGFILLILSQVFFIYLYHYIFVQKKLNDMIRKPKIVESDVEDENL